MFNLVNWIKRILYLVFCAAIFMSLRTTFVVSSDFNGLLAQVYTNEKVHSYNPFSQDFSWVGSKTAEYLILNREYPYHNCGQFTAILNGCGGSKIASVVSFLTLSRTDQDDKYYRILDHLIERGEDINGYTSWDAYPSLHIAVTSENSRLVSYCLAHGADPYIKVELGRKKRLVDAFELVERYSREGTPRQLAMKEAFAEGIMLQASKQLLDN